MCSIVSDLMKQLHGLQLCIGFRLYGEAVENYMKESTHTAVPTIKVKKRSGEW